MRGNRYIFMYVYSCATQSFRKTVVRSPPQNCQHLFSFCFAISFINFKALWPGKETFDHKRVCWAEAHNPQKALGLSKQQILARNGKISKQQMQLKSYFKLFLAKS